MRQIGWPVSDIPGSTRKCDGALDFLAIQTQRRAADQWAFPSTYHYELLRNTKSRSQYKQRDTNALCQRLSNGPKYRSVFAGPRLYCSPAITPGALVESSCGEQVTRTLQFAPESKLLQPYPFLQLSQVFGNYCCSTKVLNHACPSLSCSDGRHTAAARLRD